MTVRRRLATMRNMDSREHNEFDGSIGDSSSKTDENPYSPLQFPEDGRRSSPWPARLIRGFGLLHLFLAIVFAYFGAVLSQQGITRISRLRVYSGYSAFTGTLDLIFGLALCALAFTGLYLAVGFWRLRKWSRWAAIIQLGMFEISCAGTLEASAWYQNRHGLLFGFWNSEYILLIPAVVVAQFHLFLWSSRFSAIYAPRVSEESISD